MLDAALAASLGALRDCTVPFVAVDERGKLSWGGAGKRKRGGGAAGGDGGEEAGGGAGGKGLVHLFFFFFLFIYLFFFFIRLRLFALFLFFFFFIRLRLFAFVYSLESRRDTGVHTRLGCTRGFIHTRWFRQWWWEA